MALDPIFDSKMIQLSGNDFLSFRDLIEGVLIMGGVGAAKTSPTGKDFSRPIPAAAGRDNDPDQHARPIRHSRVAQPSWLRDSDWNTHKPLRNIRRARSL